MKRYFSFLFLIFLLIGQSVLAQKAHLYIGTYTDGDSKGIYHYLFDTKSGHLEFVDVTGEIKNPSFLKISPDKKYLYSVAEGDSFNGTKGGGVAAYKIGESGSLSKLNDALSMGAYPCHVTVSPDGKEIVASNYGGGSLAIYDVLDDGSITPIRQLIQHEGRGADPGRQASPHTHSCQYDASGTHLFAADLGIDKLKVYRFDERSKQYVGCLQSFVKMEPGAGPRHFAFTHKEDFIYVINELNSTVSVLEKDGNGYQKIQDISTLPENFDGASNCADIHLSDNEHFVYGSNRGHNSIVIFRRNMKTGMLTFMGTEPVMGDWPRNFNIDPSGKFLLVANQKSSNITVFKIDKRSGKLTFTKIEEKVPNPVCIEFLGI